MQNPCSCGVGCEVCDFWDTLDEISEAAEFGGALLLDGKIDLREALELMNAAI